MSITKSELRTRVLQHLTVLGAGETASAEDAVLIDGIIDSENAFLQTHGISTWLTSAIPDHVIEPLKRYIAARAANSFGKGDQTAQAEYELGNLYAVTARVDNTGEETEGVYF